MTRLLALTALFALLAAPAAAAALTPITVTAQGVSSTMPDMAVANLTIATYAAAAAQAASENNARYDRLLAALTRIGIARADVRTTSFSMNYNPKPEPPQTPQPGQRYGFSVYRSLSVTVHRLDLVGKTVDTAVASGVTDVNGVTFDTSRKTEQTAQALREAVQQARARAQAMAAAAGMRIVGVKAMEQGSPSRVLPAVQAGVYRMAAPAVPTQIEPSAVETRETVTVTFEAK